MTLRDYQQQMSVEMLAAITTGQNPVGVLPTGGGKSVVLTDLADRLIDAGRQVVVCTHRAEIRNQLVQHAANRGHTAEVVSASSLPAKERQPTDWESPLIVAMVPTLDRRRDTIPANDCRVSIFDEGHHLSSPSWTRVQQALGPQCSAVTATPITPSGTLITYCTALNHVVLGPDPRELMEHGFLAPYRYFAADRLINTDGIGVRGGDFIASQLAGAASELGGDVIKAWRRFNPDAVATLAACCNIAHAESVAALYQGAGISSAVIHGKLPADERQQMLDALATGDLQVLCSVAVIEEGFDLPSLGCLQMLRPTKSLRVKRQLEGRILRVTPGQDHAIVIDHTRNFTELPFPCEAIDWLAKGGEVRTPRTKSQKVEKDPTSGEVRIRQMTPAEVREVDIAAIIAAREATNDREAELLLDLRGQIELYQAGEIRGSRLESWLYGREFTTEKAWRELARAFGHHHRWGMHKYHEWWAAQREQQQLERHARRVEESRRVFPTALLALLAALRTTADGTPWWLDHCKPLSDDGDHLVLELAAGVVDHYDRDAAAGDGVDELNQRLSESAATDRVGRPIRLDLQIEELPVTARSATQWAEALEAAAAGSGLPSLRALVLSAITGVEPSDRGAVLQVEPVDLDRVEHRLPELERALRRALRESVELTVEAA